MLNAPPDRGSPAEPRTSVGDFGLFFNTLLRERIKGGRVYWQSENKMENPAKERNMKLGSRLAMGTTVVCLLGSMLASGQARPQQRVMADQVHKNIQVLKGLPEDEFMATMGFFFSSLGENCTYCHVAESGGSWEKYADDNDHKKTARAMIGMMNVINKNFFGGRRVVTCYSCHRGGERPDVTPSIADLY